MKRLQYMIEYASRIRALTLFAIFHAKSGHPGGSLSCVDILTHIFCHEFSAQSSNKFILSKGHAAPALYAAAVEFGILKPGDLLTFRKINSRLQGHPHNISTPWVGSSTGSLGQGISAALGISLGFKFLNLNNRTFVVLGDGEMQEGQVWEAALTAAHYKLDNLCAIVDYNKLQSDDFNENVISLKSLRAKWLAFNWNVLEINGHDFGEIHNAFLAASNAKGMPSLIIAHTIKGKGVSFMEGVPAWHGSVSLRKEDFSQALCEIGVSNSLIPRFLDGSIVMDV